MDEKELIEYEKQLNDWGMMGVDFPEGTWQVLAALRTAQSRVAQLEAVREAAQDYMEHIGELNKNMAHRHPCIVNDHEELTWGCWINQKLKAALSAADNQQGQG